MTPPRHITVLGAGAWGTALAHCLAGTGHEVTLWGRASVGFEELSQTRRHPALPNFRLDKRVDCAPVIDIVAAADVAVLATPAQTVRALAARMIGLLPRSAPIILTAKGIERGTGALMPDVIREALPGQPVALLSGPTFAAEIGLGLPGAATMAAGTIRLADEMAALFQGTALRLYASDDLTGAALGGAFKNVLAIAAGAVIGAGLGANARAAVISRGLAELSRLGRVLGARADTLGGLSGLGDIVLSCTDAKSRNYSHGFALGQGLPPPERLAEGALTVAPLLDLARRHEIEMPIAEAVDSVINHGQPLDQAVASLLNRPGARE